MNTTPRPITTGQIYHTADVKIGDRVRVTSPVRNFDETVEVGETGTVVGFGGHHHTMNGGGFDVIVDFGRMFSGFDTSTSKWTQVRGKHDRLTVNSKNLEVIA